MWTERVDFAAYVVLAINIVYIIIHPFDCGTEELAKSVDELKVKLKILRKQLIHVVEQTKSLQMKSRYRGGRTKAAAGYSKRDPPPPDPPLEYEILRHRLYSDARELWYFVEDQINNLYPNSSTDIKKTIRALRNQWLAILSNLEELPLVDNYMPWRIQAAEYTSKVIQKRLNYLQNPSSLVNVKKVACNINLDCGFGCQLHHLVYCLLYGFDHESPVVLLPSHKWNYDSRGWQAVFEPLSDTCDSPEQSEPDTFDNLEYLGLRAGLNVTPSFMPLAIPTDLAERMLKFTGDPASWWMGQLIKFILKPRWQFLDLLAEKMKEIGFTEPIVGIHIRRTDKVDKKEAAFHNLSEYMKHVDIYYDKLELSKKVRSRRVYLVSDDPEVFQEARTTYSNYVFYGDPAHSASADPRKRYGPASLTCLLLDMYLLAACHYLVCTFSSKLGTDAYLMMQANRMDASHSVQSLDDIFYYDGQHEHHRLVLHQHKATGEGIIEMKVGDRILVLGNHWNGFGKGVNKRTSQVGLFPYYKTTDILRFHNFPKYILRRKERRRISNRTKPGLTHRRIWGKRIN